MEQDAIHITATLTSSTCCFFCAVFLCEALDFLIRIKCALEFDLPRGKKTLGYDMSSATSLLSYPIKNT